MWPRRIGGITQKADREAPALQTVLHRLMCELAVDIWLSMALVAFLPEQWRNSWAPKAARIGRA